MSGITFNVRFHLIRGVSGQSVFSEAELLALVNDGIGKEMPLA